jgi:transmembrane sensor
LNLEEKNWLLIQRYVTGNASPDERRKVQQWIDQDSDHEQLVHDLKGIWNLSEGEDFEVDIQHAWEKFKNQNHNKFPKAIRPVGYVPRKKSRKGIYILRAAAVILVAFLAGLFIQYNSGLINTEQASIFNTLQELETDKGEKARITFSDGTRVTLNSASTVQFPQEFRGSTREVYLEGEAYFEVAYNSEYPFIVHSQEAEIEVLGTEFNVRGWNEDSGVDIVVSGGSVSVRSAKTQSGGYSKVILNEGFKTRVEKGQNPVLPQEVDIRNHLLWTSGGMHFHNEPLEQVARSLERRFNVEIAITDVQHREIPYTGTFQYAELDEVLSVIAASLSIEYVRDGVKIEFR